MKKTAAILCLIASTAYGQSFNAPVMGTVPVTKTESTQSEQAIKSSNTHKNTTSPQKNKPIQLTPPPSQITKDLYKSLRNGNFQIAELLIQQGGDINCLNCGDEELPLLTFAFMNDINKTQWMLSRGANINLKNTWSGNTPILAAARTVYPSENYISFLVQQGANINDTNSKGDTITTLLVRNSARTELIKTIINLGADLNKKDGNGYTPLMYAASQCNIDYVKLLLQRGATANTNSPDENTANSIAYKRAIDGNKKCNDVMSLLKEGVPKLDEDITYNPSQPASRQNSGTFQQGEWQGVLNATNPRQSSTSVNAVIANNGDIRLTTQTGFSGNGKLAMTGNNVDGTLTIKSGTDQYGKPLVTDMNGSPNILYTVNGTLNNGIMRGRYSSNIESGNFLLCDANAAKQNTECQPSGLNGVVKAVGGVLGILDAVLKPR